MAAMTTRAHIIPMIPPVDNPNESESVSNNDSGSASIKIYYFWWEMLIFL